MNKLQELLVQDPENHILPFFWQHGEEETLLREGVQQIHASGAGALCIESRPHPDFLGPKWWQDVDVIFDECRKYGMEIWVLDDSHYPSGYANGLAAAEPDCGMRYLARSSMDVVGPLKGASFQIRIAEDEALIAVTAARHVYRGNGDFRPAVADRPQPGTDQLDVTDVRILTSDVVREGDGVGEMTLYLDIPEGVWVITTIRSTPRGLGRDNYINPLDVHAVARYLETVYQPFLDHYGADAGGLFRGFFADEPGLFNAGQRGIFVQQAPVGSPDLTLPYSPALLERLSALWGGELARHLTALWLNVADLDTAETRARYMDAVTQTYQAAFSEQIGNWCRAHDLEYIGHVIEDGDCHCGTGLGAGHYFRAMAGQDMAGVDVVLQQLRPGLEHSGHYRIGGAGGYYYGAFYHYTLAKLAVSDAQMDPKKEGRSICEIFGAYGWSEGVRMMRFLADHMLVNGINHFVPHAFTMKPFPDPDHPPHFHARGNDGQFELFAQLMPYMNRVADLISGGVFASDVAVLYEAEADWAGPHASMTMICQALTQAQIQFTIISEDMLSALHEKNEQGQPFFGPGFQALFYVDSAWRSPSCTAALSRLEAAGIPCIEVTSQTALSDIAPQVEDRIRRDLALVPASPWIRTYHYVRTDGTQILMLMNGSPTERYVGAVSLLFAAGIEVSRVGVVRYDAFANRTTPVTPDDSWALPLELEPLELAVFCIGEGKGCRAHSDGFYTTTGVKTIAPSIQWSLSMEELRDGVWSEVRPAQALPELTNLSAKNAYPLFSGRMVYTGHFTLEERGAVQVLDLGEVYETAQVTLNGQDCGCAISAPYRFEIGDALQAGENVLTVVVTNNLGHRMRDGHSATMPMEPSGLLGPVRIW